MPLGARFVRAFAIAVVLASAGCREELCVKTVTAVCRCQDPLMPNLESCQASAEIVSCAPSAWVDPCVASPCCRLAPTDDGGARDAGRDLGAPMDAAAADLGAGGG